MSSIRADTSLFPRIKPSYRISPDSQPELIHFFLLRDAQDPRQHDGVFPMTTSDMCRGVKLQCAPYWSDSAGSSLLPLLLPGPTTPGGFLRTHAAQPPVCAAPPPPPCHFTSIPAAALTARALNHNYEGLVPRARARPRHKLHLLQRGASLHYREAPSGASLKEFY